MDSRYLESCHVGTPFYNPFVTFVSTVGRPIQRETCPPLWTASREGVWEVWTPILAGLRLQGWKIHVGAVAADAASTLAAVTAYCVSREIPFKFLRTAELLAESNSKSASRSSSGKFITIYPPSDDVLESAARDLAGLLRGRGSPYILSDFRHETGPVYFRYGAFLGISATDDRDDLIPSRVDHSLTLVPDERLPSAVLPLGLPVPAIVRSAVAAYEQEMPESPLLAYKEIKSLQHSNGGGVYSATRVADGTKVVLKEGRPFAGLDFRGRDAVERLKVEFEALRALEGTGVAPRPHRLFEAWEHHFLEMEFVPGVPLNSWIAMNYPFRADEGSDHLEAYTDVALAILRNLLDAIERVHATGRVLGDLHPANVMVDSDHRVRIIDHEDGRSVDDCEPPSFNAIGFRAPEGVGPSEADWFAASRIAMMLFQVQSAMEILAPDYWDEMLRIVRRDFGSEAADAVAAVATRCAMPPKAPMQLRPGVPVTPWFNSTPVEYGDVSELADRIANGIEQTVEMVGSRRRYPGDIAQTSALGALNVRSGAAGVVMAVHRAGGGVSAGDRDWLVSRTVQSIDSESLGLFSGLAGIASVLFEIGCDEIAERVVNSVRGRYRRLKRLDLHSGLAGIGLSMLSLAQAGVDAGAEEIALDIASVIAARVEMLDPTRTGLNAEPGLFFGWSGLSVFFAAVADHQRDPRYARLATTCLRNDADFTSTYGRGIVGVQDQAVNRSLPYLGRGSAGVLFAAMRTPGALDDLTMDGLVASCRSRYYAMSGLYNGTAGILATLGSLPADASARAHSELLVRNLWDYALRWGDSMQFAGEGYLRLSSDLSTGSSGILAALTSFKTGQPAWLPTVQEFTLDSTPSGSRNELASLALT